MSKATMGIGDLVRITCKDGLVKTGYVLLIQIYTKEDFKPHGEISIVQDYRFVKDEEDFDFITFEFSKIKSIIPLDAATGKVR